MSSQDRNAKFQILISEIDKAIRHGRSHFARQKLVAAVGSRPPRFALASLASCFRRIGMSNQALRILYPIIRSEKPIFPPPSEKERAVYAAALIAIGSNQEAMLILTQLDWRKTPEALLYQCIHHFTRWDYRATLPLLKRYLKHPGLNAYERLVGQINLAAALLVERKLDETTTILSEITPLLREQNLQLLYGNCLELGTQVAIARKDFDLAERLIGTSKGLLASTLGRNLLYANRWHSILKLERGDLDSLQKLQEVRAMALAQNVWEVVRDCDLYRAVTTNNEGLLSHVAFGTPLPGYSRRIESLLGRPFKICKDLTVKPSLDKSMSMENPMRVLDLNLCQESGGQCKIKFGGTLHVAIESLSMDFYRPLRRGELFSHLWPEEKFNPFTSPDRVANVIKRLRKWFASERIPLAVKVQNSGEYHLHAIGNYHLKMTRSKTPRTLPQHRIRQLLKKLWPYQNFSASQIRMKFGSQYSQFMVAVKLGCSEGKIFRSGRGRSTRYRFSR